MYKTDFGTGGSLASPETHEARRRSIGRQRSGSTRDTALSENHSGRDGSFPRDNSGCKATIITSGVPYRVTITDCPVRTTSSISLEKLRRAYVMLTSSKVTSLRDLAGSFVMYGE
nr:hypothetical protein [Agromyces agglutinans]